MNTLCINGQACKLDGDKDEYGKEWLGELTAILENSIFSVPSAQRLSIVHVWVRALRRLLSDRSILQLFKQVKFNRGEVMPWVYGGLYYPNTSTPFSPKPFELHAVRTILQRWEMLSNDTIDIESPLAFGLRDYVHSVLPSAGRMPHCQEHYFMLQIEKTLKSTTEAYLGQARWAEQAVAGCYV